MKLRNIALLIGLTLALTGCADAVDINNPSSITGEPAGFFHGLWHGWIIWFAWIISLFDDNVAIYAVNNTGGWYDFGYIIGLGGITASVKRSVY